MIKCRFFKENSHYSGFEISGHADYDDHGRDIVCAAVSVLATTAYNSLEFHVKDKVSSKIIEEDGFFNLRLKKLDEDEMKISDVILKTMEIGIESIAMQYPNYVAINKEVGKNAKA